MKRDDQAPETFDLKAYFNERTKNHSREKVLADLREHLQTAVHIELATIPIYLYTYYSIHRKGRSGDEMNDIDLFLNKAGAVIMSVAVEEMLHMSLSSNVLFALGGMPTLYGQAPSAYPTGLPLHKPTGPAGPHGDRAVTIPLAKFSFEQLWHFLQIEYPDNPKHHPPQGNNWTSLSQLYAYIIHLINSPLLSDSDFQQGDAHLQIQPYNYTANNIDTLYPKTKFDPWAVPGSNKGGVSGSEVAQYTNNKDSGRLIRIHSKATAIEALTTICDQGEGMNWSPTDDPAKLELSHYYKFLTLQAQLAEYPNTHEQLASAPAKPDPITPSFSAEQLANNTGNKVVDFPDNPTTDALTDPTALQISKGIDAVFQYMLILSETLFKVRDLGPNSPDPNGQKRFFNEGLHRTMIWVLDKLSELAQTTLVNGCRVVPTFANAPLLGKPQGGYQDAFQKLNAILSPISQPDYAYYFQRVINSVPDVAPFWNQTKPSGPGYPVPSPYPFKDAPTWHYQIGIQPTDLPLHACMGLNACKSSDRFGQLGPADGPTPGKPNDCAGQGYCATSGYNFLDPASSNGNHTCHVQNDCRNQGGCGLYGTGEEQNSPGHNACKSMGSCATPINAERFSTAGPNQGKSVWLRARAVFEENWAKTRAELLAKHPHLELPEKPGQAPEPFASSGGPAYLWFSDNNKDRGNMTACGSSGLSGAGGCT